jgi:hypothetical protein
MFRPILKYIFLNVRTWAVSVQPVLTHVDSMRWVSFELVEAESYTLIWQLSCIKLLQVKDIWNELNEGDFVGLSLFDPPTIQMSYYDWRKRNPAWHIHLQYWLIMYWLVQDRLDPRKHVRPTIRFMSPIEYLLTATINSVHAINW